MTPCAGLCPVPTSSLQVTAVSQWDVREEWIPDKDAGACRRQDDCYSFPDLPRPSQSEEAEQLWGSPSVGQERRPRSGTGRKSLRSSAPSDAHVGSLLSEEQQCGLVSLCLLISHGCLSLAEAHHNGTARLVGMLLPALQHLHCRGTTDMQTVSRLDTGRWTLCSFPTQWPLPRPPLRTGIAPSSYPFLELLTYDLIL